MCSCTDIRAISKLFFKARLWGNGRKAHKTSAGVQEPRTNQNRWKASQRNLKDSAEWYQLITKRVTLSMSKIIISSHYNNSKIQKAFKMRRFKWICCVFNCFGAKKFKKLCILICSNLEHWKRIILAAYIIHIIQERTINNIMLK